jgi:hypothetical protein
MMAEQAIGPRARERRPPARAEFHCDDVFYQQMLQTLCLGQRRKFDGSIFRFLPENRIEY